MYSKKQTKTFLLIQYCTEKYFIINTQRRILKKRSTHNTSWDDEHMSVESTTSRQAELKSSTNPQPLRILYEDSSKQNPQATRWPPDTALSPANR